MMTMVPLTGLLLIKATVPSDVVTQVTSRHEVDDQVQVLAILERIVHVHKEAKHPIYSS